MSEKKKIDALEALGDLRKGMTNSQLMEKYGLTSRGVRSLLTKIQGALENCAGADEDSDTVPVPGREVSAKEVLNDIRASCDYAALMEKYKLSRAGVDHLFEQLQGAGLLKQKKQVKLSEIGVDLKRGASEPDLMEKYRLSLGELQKIVRQLAEIHYLKLEEIQGLQFVYYGIMNSPRKKMFPIVATQVYEVLDPETLGRLKYLNSDKIGVRGIPAVLSKNKILVLQSSAFRDGKPLVFDVRCVSTTTDAADVVPIAEFKIVNIAACILREFQEFAATCTMDFEPRNYFSVDNVPEFSERLLIQ
ncbi:MAG TPA: hypothetical protein VK463_06540 [Desulfomonilaceae bacterium]|nr:hypothetical protein [Desulfomonilaceae bacterium]